MADVQVHVVVAVNEDVDDNDDVDDDDARSTVQFLCVEVLGGHRSATVTKA